MTDMSRVVSAITAALAVPLVLAGCGPTSEQFHEEIRVAVVASDPIIEEAFVTGSVGLAGFSARVRIYVTSTEPQALERAIDAALRATLTAAPVRPSGMGIDVAEVPMPADPSILSGNLNIIDEIAQSLGFGYSDGSIGGITDDFEERYGQWEDLRR